MQPSVPDLYEDQKEFIDEIRKLWPHHNRICGMAPTGFGKTVVAAKIIKAFADKGKRVLFVVPRISLIEQTERSFRNHGITDITRIWAGHEFKPSAKVVIASADTLIRREKGEYDLTIIDECHLRKKKLLEWMLENPDDRYLGFSGTPYADWMGTYYTALAKAKPMRWLIDHGRLADYEVYAPQSPDLSSAKVTYGEYGADYREEDIAAIMGGAQVVGNIVEHWLRHGENRLTMALCVNVAHANHLCIEFSKQGVPAEVVTASTPVEEREMIFSRMRSGVTRVVTSVNALTEGLDVKEIGCVINARPTKSPARYIQGMGRGLRAAKGKDNCLIFDHSGTTLSLGMPEDIHIDFLSAKSDGMKTAKSRSKETAQKLPKECPQCHYLKPAGMYVCVKCGFKPMAGEDVETDESRGLVKVKKRKKAAPKIDKQTFYAELLGYQREREAMGRPIKDGFVANLYKAKFGVWPKGLQRITRPVSIDTRNHIRAQAIAYARKQKENGAWGH